MWCNCNESKILNNWAWAASKGAYGGGRGTWSLYVWRAWVHIFRGCLVIWRQHDFEKGYPGYPPPGYGGYPGYGDWPSADVCRLQMFAVSVIPRLLSTTSTWLLCSCSERISSCLLRDFDVRLITSTNKTNVDIFSKKTWDHWIKQSHLTKKTWTQKWSRKAETIGIPWFHRGLWISTSSGIWIWWLSANANASKAGGFFAKWRRFLGDFQKGSLRCMRTYYVYIHPRIFIIIS